MSNNVDQDETAHYDTMEKFSRFLLGVLKKKKKNILAGPFSHAGV